jgi:hypothetical protein
MGKRVVEVVVSIDYAFSMKIEPKKVNHENLPLGATW